MIASSGQKKVRGLAQFVGAAGQYYLAYSLAVRGINASLTVGNAPSVDVLVSAADGSTSLSIQVKTSRNAYRRKRYGLEGFEWDAGAISKHSGSFWYAFVNLREDRKGWNPRVFFVPSRWVAEFGKRDFSRQLYFLPITAQKLTEERWDLVKAYLANDGEAKKWAVAWPKEVLCQWGKDGFAPSIETS